MKPYEPYRPQLWREIDKALGRPPPPLETRFDNYSVGGLPPGFFDPMLLEPGIHDASPPTAGEGASAVLDPLQLYRIDETHIGVVYGTISGLGDTLVPAIGGVSLDTLPAPSLEITESCHVLIHCTLVYDDDDELIGLDEVEIIKNGGIPESTDTDIYIDLGVVNFADGAIVGNPAETSARRSSLELVLCGGTLAAFRA